MKFKLISLTVVATALLTVPHAKADWEYQSFLKPQVTSICLSNDLAVNMGVGYTNLASVAAIGGIGRGTNMPGTMWTNNSYLSSLGTNVPGTQIIITNGGYYAFPFASTNSGFFTNASGSSAAVDFNKLNLLQDVTLWTDKEGRPMLLSPNAANNPTNYYSYGTLFFSLVGGSGANSAVTFRFVPLYDGTNQPNQAGEFIAVSVTANTTTVVNLSTNLIASRVIGAKKLRLVDIVNADADASSSVQLLKVGFAGWRP